MKIKQIMEDALDVIENSGLSCAHEEAVAQALCIAVEGYDKQEPVAYIGNRLLDMGCGGIVLNRDKDSKDFEDSTHVTPLYTHPQKELSDEDILKHNICVEGLEYYVSAPDDDLLKFARAVLKAARE
ncbi:MAG: hypothetical protein JKY80_02025 [Mariprofundaceae bacterium]|nr:hypothetical protein [Methylophaga sp.]MBL4759618.1 hypothetical protein [Mariprofundaceae bacterium]